jgi:hypothetical protein
MTGRSAGIDRLRRRAAGARRAYRIDRWATVRRRDRRWRIAVSENRLTGLAGQGVITARRDAQRAVRERRGETTVAPGPVAGGHAREAPIGTDLRVARLRTEREMRVRQHRRRRDKERSE